jgi:hypothetical protein
VEFEEFLDASAEHLIVPCAAPLGLGQVKRLLELAKA